MPAIYLEQVHPPHYISIPQFSLTFRAVFGGFHYTVFIHIDLVYFHPLQPQWPETQSRPSLCLLRDIISLNIQYCTLRI
jgi:hypothetical protein